MAYGDIVEIDGKNYKEINPILTSNNTPEPYKVTFNYEHIYNEISGPAFHAFWDYGTWGGHVEWIVLDMGVPTQVDAICSGRSVRARVVKFQGSMNGISFIDICQSKIIDSTYENVIKQVLNLQVNYRYYKWFFIPISWESIAYLKLYKKCNNYMLLKDNDFYKTIEDNILTIVDNTTITKEIIETQGFKNLNNIVNIKVQLSDEYEILTYNPENANNSISIKYIPKQQLVVSNGDIEVSHFKSIKNITLNTTGTIGVVKVVISTDKGETWKTFKDNIWQEINLNIDDVKIDGINHNELANILGEKWNEIKSDKLRFAYYLEKTLIIDDIAVDKLTITGDMGGSWKRTNDTNYDYEYQANDTLTIKLLTNGDYKINY